jgi:calcineurin-like phosphoesterase family protein
MKTFYISDTHFYHKNIIKYCNRPFHDIEEMNYNLIKNWNDKVSPKDIVYHLGDFGFASYVDLKSVFNSLNGIKYLIKGNHDDNRVLRLDWENIYEYKEIKDGDNHIVLFHYPMLEWNKKYSGAYHFHGHIHNSIFPVDASFKRVNVSVDVINFEPVTFDDIIQN